MKLIPLTRGKFAQVDDDDFEWLSQWKWQAGECSVKGTFRAQRRGDGNKTILMHRQIMGVSERWVLVDHADGNPLNNQRYNIRTATTLQNGQNQGTPKNNTSGYKGVTWSKQHKKWLVGVKVEYVKRFIGLYDNIEDAARAYNCVARRAFGEFARFNQVSPMFPDVEVSMKIGRANSYGFVGIHKSGKKFMAEIGSKENKCRLGRFKTPEEAARAYDEAAKNLYGSKAKLNFPNE